MAKRSRMSVLKRQREMGKAEKAARKRRKRHGVPEVGPQEPTATVKIAELLGKKPSADEDAPEGGNSGSRPVKDRE